MIKSQIANRKSQSSGFTLIELIIYLGIVSIILVSISYLILDILGGQTKNYANAEVNQNLRFITNMITKDIKAASAISSLTADTLVLTLPGDDITYNFNSGTKTIDRQLGVNPAVSLNSSHVEIKGNFSDLSYLALAKNVGIHLEINYKNPGNLPDYNASTIVDFAVELRGRR